MNSSARWHSYCVVKRRNSFILLRRETLAGDVFPPTEFYVTCQNGNSDQRKSRTVHIFCRVHHLFSSSHFLACFALFGQPRLVNGEWNWLGVWAEKNNNNATRSSSHSRIKLFLLLPWVKTLTFLRLGSLWHQAARVTYTTGQNPISYAKENISYSKVHGSHSKYRNEAMTMRSQ